MSALNDQIVAMISAEAPKSGDVVELIEAVKGERETLNADRCEVEAKAIDPLAKNVDYEGAAVRLRELDLLLARNEAATSRLQLVLEAAEYREDQVKRVEARAKASEFVSLATEMMAAAELQLASALEQARDAEAWAISANNALPDGAEPLVIPENVAFERVIERQTVERFCVDNSNHVFEGAPPPPAHGEHRARRWFTREVFLPRGKTEPMVRYIWDREKNGTPASHSIGETGRVRLLSELRDFTLPVFVPPEPPKIGGPIRQSA